MTRYASELPTAQGFIALRRETDWGAPNLADARIALDRSLCGVTAWDGERLIGMARCVGDGVMILYIQDVIIAADYRGKGIGRALLQQLIADLQERYRTDCTVGLFAAVGQDGFYKRFGFSARSNASYGPGLHARLGALTAALATPHPRA